MRWISNAHVMMLMASMIGYALVKISVMTDKTLQGIETAVSVYVIGKNVGTDFYAGPDHSDIHDYDHDNYHYYYYYYHYHDDQDSSKRCSCGEQNYYCCCC